MKIYMDEAGRGPLYGPLHIGLVAKIKVSESELKKHLLFKDSKALTPKKREEAFNEILALEKEEKIIYKIGSIDAENIDRFGVTRAINLAVMKALYRLILPFLGLNTKKEITIKDLKNILNIYEKNHEAIEIIFDGKTDFGIGKELGIKTSTIVHGDANQVEIAMASILAKVSRDKILDTIALKFPNYHFQKHKGYGTKLHYEAIEKYGILKGHRKLFLKRIFPNWKIQDYDNNFRFSTN